MGISDCFVESSSSEIQRGDKLHSLWEAGSWSLRPKLLPSPGPQPSSSAASQSTVRRIWDTEAESSLFLDKNSYPVCLKYQLIWHISISLLGCTLTEGSVPLYPLCSVPMAQQFLTCLNVPYPLMVTGLGLCSCPFMELSPLPFPFGQVSFILQLKCHHFWKTFLETHIGLFSLCALVGSWRTFL